MERRLQPVAGNNQGGASHSGAGVADPYAKQNAYQARRAHKKSNVAPIPGVVDPERKKACGESFRLFCETYFAEAFCLKWSPDHLLAIEKIEQAVRNGDWFALAMPRGSGKTTLIWVAALWAVAYGLSKYVFIVAATGPLADRLLENIKKAIETNELLFQDFPEICHPVRQLQGAAANAAKQHADGVPTDIDWRSGCAQMPTIAGSMASGAMISAAGVTSAARGAQVLLADGRVLRPSLVLVDDFQTRESAASPSQTKSRMATIAGDLAGMRGPNQPLAMLAAVTVIYKEDGADQLLDHEAHPEWQGIKRSAVRSWPEDEQKWERYAELWREGYRAGERSQRATAYYAENREDMDRGAEVYWPERMDAGELSGLQHLMNQKLRVGDEAFAAEYQNEPIADDDIGFKPMTADEITAKLNGLAQGDIDEAVEAITVGIDTQSDHLWFAVVAWEQGFGGTVLDYGAWPKQATRYYTKRTLRRTFADLYPGMTEEQAIYAAQKELIAELAGRSWRTPTGSELRVRLMLLDEGYKTETTHLACRGTPHASIVQPAKGIGIKAGQKPMAEWVRKRTDPPVRNAHWVERTAAQRSLRHVVVDTNFWKTFLHERLRTAPGGGGCLNLWGKRSVHHIQFAQHLTAEYPTSTEGNGRRLVEWAPKPAKPDNDLFDAMVLAAVAASKVGISLDKDVLRPTPPAIGWGGKPSLLATLGGQT